MANCTICSKIPVKKRYAIDEMLVSGATLSSIAEEHFPDKPFKTVEGILMRHRDNGHIQQRAGEIVAIEMNEHALNITDMVTRIFERALSLSMKAEALAVTSRDMESSCKCLDTAIKSLSVLGISKEDKETNGIGALEDYMAEQRRKAKAIGVVNANAGSEPETT